MSSVFPLMTREYGSTAKYHSISKSHHEHGITWLFMEWGTGRMFTRIDSKKPQYVGLEKS